MRKRKVLFAVVFLLLSVFISFPAESAVTTYRITYHGTGNNFPKTQKKRSKKKKVLFKVSGKKPRRTGYTFTGWNSKKKGNGRKYRPGQKIYLTKKKNILKLYATWKKTAVKETAKENTESQKTFPKTGSGTLEKLEVHYIDVGQGDCTLIRCGGKTLVIDAGDNTKGTSIQYYLTSKGVTKIDYLIGTHPDADHIGGLDVLINKFDIGMLFMPDTEKDTRTYDDVLQAAKYKSLKITVPKPGAVYSLGTATFQVVSTGYDYGDKTNNWSIAIRVVNGSNSFLFTGDAEEEAEQDMLKTGYTLSSDVYKASHHGSRTASTESFLKTVNPKFAVISCGANNDYGHPHAEVMNRLRSMGVSIYRTDEQGTIIATSDGSTIKWSTMPTDSWTAGEPKGTSAMQYILNTNTKVIHLPTCPSVLKMSEKNKKETYGFLNELESAGYKPCGNCIG